MPSSGSAALTFALLHCPLVLPYHICLTIRSPQDLPLAVFSAWSALPQLTLRCSLSSTSSLLSDSTFLVRPAPTTLQKIAMPPLSLYTILPCFMFLQRRCHFITFNTVDLFDQNVCKESTFVHDLNPAPRNTAGTR